MADGTDNSTAPLEKNGAPESENGQSPHVEEEGGIDHAADVLIPLTVLLPHEPREVKLMVSPHEQVHELRQSIIELPSALQYSCFHLEHAGQRINDYVQISDVEGIGPESEVKLVEDPYTEKEARLHLVRIRELIGAAGDRTDTIQGLLAGTSLFDTVVADSKPPSEYSFSATASLSHIIPKDTPPAPKTVKSIALSSWNPPPVYLRQKGHLLYLIVTTNEGEQYQITSHVGGFYVNRSSNSKFDPSPRAPPKGIAGHSLLTVLEKISPSFSSLFAQFQEVANKRDPLATFQITNATPAAPWLVPALSSRLCAHQPDTTRTQESYLLSGVDNTDTLRDWNEEFQSARELPKDAVADRVFRERLTSKLFADYTDAAAKGAVMVARGEVAPLNPTEGRDAQIFVYNNVFFSFGADGVGTFTSEGGDEAARVATGKDVMGVRLVNQLDIDGLFTPATVVVDYLGKRIVGQSIVPGIFKQREPGENQIDYGAVDGKDVVANDEKFVSGFAKLSTALKVKKHPVWDKDGKRFDLEASVETKGLLGTDGRKYVLDLYRITPLDIAWLEGKEGGYPHRMTVLRPELVEAFVRSKTREWYQAETARLAEAKSDNAASAGNDSKPDLSNFKFALNPDVFSGQIAQTEEEKEALKKDEEDVRLACAYLQDSVIPELLNDLKESECSFPMDGRSLSRLLHKRGINVRYIGNIASRCEGSRLATMREICIQEMIARSFKHIAGRYLKNLPLATTSSCISHLLNCLLGAKLNPAPVAQVEDTQKDIFPDIDLSFQAVSPVSLSSQIEEETLKRYRFTLESGWESSVKHLQLLREVCLKLGIQLQAKSFNFGGPSIFSCVTPTDGEAKANGEPKASDVKANVDGKKKKKKPSLISPPSQPAACTFSPDDVVNIVPIIKDSSPKSSLAEEALEAGRISILQSQRKLGQELLLESLSLHEQIYGILHPEVARVYHHLSLLYYQLDEREAALELARKAIIVSERTIGIDSEETLLNYLNLSLFLYQMGDSNGALSYAQYALNLWKIIYGHDHPDSITTINNAAVMFQQLKAYHESRRWFEESLRICEDVFGKQSVNAATLLFQLAQALALDGESKAAVSRMKDSYGIFLAELGPEDKNTKEAESWLEQLTQSAVSIAKHAKDIQARRLRSGIRFAPRASTSAAEGTSASKNDPSKVTAIDSRSIDELIKFIEGNDQQVKSTKKRPGRGNPKRRGNVS